MTSRSAVLAVLLTAAAALAACGRPDSGRAAPDFSLRSSDGKTVSLSAQRGHVVLLNFWATWCDSCKEELPALQALERKDGSRFVLLAVSVDDDPSKVVPRFAVRHGLDFPLLYADRATQGAYAVRLLPTTYLIAPDGSIVRRYVGPIDPRAVENDIVSLLKRSSS
jgi:peroxiredoxin